ncbi:MAG: hypothetical protein GVY10_05835, partial [Verrucomicrobia bacterium]|nr:hypothetical protein [Verrucomicrobiota bacterium]
SHRPWWVLWLFSSSVMVAVVLYGWFNYNGDPSYNRLNKLYEKSIHEEVAEAQEATELALKAVEAEPEQPRILAELETLRRSIEETNLAFVEKPEELDAAMAGLEEALLPVREELTRPDVPNPQQRVLEKVVAETESLQEQMLERRDVKFFITWKHLLPPLVLLFLTRFGFPVSTSFLVLVSFQPAVMPSMLTKSLMGYAVAMVAGLVLYFLIMRAVEARWRRQGEANIGWYWVVFQWGSTAFLWSMWLIQDMANIFVYLPRQPTLSWLLLGVGWMVAVQAFIYYSRGGKIQKVVTSKTNTHDIRSATIVDLTYGLVLYIFKIQSNVPMSTTWVFLGLLAGRELAFALSKSEGTSLMRAFKLARKDMVKAGFGLGVSVIIALLIDAI